MPGEHETFGLVALEAAACGTPVAACSTAPALPAIGALGHGFVPGDPDGLDRAIAAARAARADPQAAATDRLAPAARLCAETAAAAELDDLASWRHGRRRDDRRVAARRRARDLRALRADPRLARRPRRRPRHAAGHPGPRPASVPRPPAGPRRVAGRARTGGRRRRPARLPAPRPAAGRGAARRGEFIGLDGAETRRAVPAGRRVLKLAGIQPRGFVAPGYAYTTRCARRSRRPSTGGRALAAAPRRRARRLAPALALGTSALKRLELAGVVRAGARCRATSCGSTSTRPTSTTRATWARSRRSSRRAAAAAVTYDELAAADAPQCTAVRSAPLPAREGSACCPVSFVWSLAPAWSQSPSRHRPRRPVPPSALTTATRRTRSRRLTRATPTAMACTARRCRARARQAAETTARAAAADDGAADRERRDAAARRARPSASARPRRAGARPRPPARGRAAAGTSTQAGRRASRTGGPPAGRARRLAREPRHRG